MSQKKVSGKQLDWIQLTSLVEDSHVKMLVSQENIKDSKDIEQHYGKNTLESLAKLDQDGLWLKMYQDSFQLTMEGSLEKFLETWPEVGMMQNGFALKQVTLEHPMKEKEYLSLPTPRARDGLDFIAHFSKKSILKVIARSGDISLPYIYQLLGIPIRDWPTYHEWMMGFPIEWTELGQWVMR